MKPRHLLPALLLLTLPTLVLAKGWVKDPNTGCELWTFSANAVSWEGACIGGKASGNGTATYRQGGKILGMYEGEVEDGKKHGQGVYIWADGARYEGQFKDDKQHGQGVYIWTDGDRYEGQFKDDKQHGQGVYIWADGDRYEGQHKDGKSNGQGVYIGADGWRYEGQFKDDKKHGQGVYIWADGRRYEGAWRNDQRHGLGRETNADGSLYHEGQWANGQAVQVAAAPEPAGASSSASDTAEAERRQRNRNACLKQCEATKSNMQAMCAEMSDEAKYGIFDSSPKNQCQLKTYDAERQCQSACRSL